jgi:hypothetical protein
MGYGGLIHILLFSLWDLLVKMGTPSGNPSFGPLFTGDSPVRLTPQPGIPGRGALFAGVRAPLVVSGKVRAGGAGARRAHIGAPQGVAPSTLGDNLC